MIVRFGYVAMSVNVKNASPSKTMTAAAFRKIADREAAVRKLERIAEENLANTLRILRHNRAYDIRIYRFSSRLVPLIGHEMLEDWDPLPHLEESFRQIGDYVKANDMRVSFHPDHFTVVSTPRADVLESSRRDLDRHVRMLELMGLSPRAMCNIHIGGAYGNKQAALVRFLNQFGALDERIRRRITLENDDKTFTAKETLEACKRVGVPMVLDIHHHDVNHDGEEIADLWPDIQETWKHTEKDEEGLPLPPKVHVSSPKNEKDPRAHADFVDSGRLLSFLRSIGGVTPRLDVMIEAKQKDDALFRLIKDLMKKESIQLRDQASIQL